MKCNYFNATSLKTAVKSLFLVLTVVVVSFSAKAQAFYASSTNSANAVVSYLGTEGDQMSFRLKFDNESGEKFAVTILDSEGVVLFDEVFTDKKFNKVFRTPAEIGRLTFTISNPKNKNQKIEISTEKRLVEEVLVTKVG